MCERANQPIETDTLRIFGCITQCLKHRTLFVSQFRDETCGCMHAYLGHFKCTPHSRTEPLSVDASLSNWQKKQ